VRANLGDIAATAPAARREELPIAPATHGLARACARAAEAKVRALRPVPIPRLDPTPRGAAAAGNGGPAANGGRAT